MNKTSQSQSGFTLIQLAVVVTILGILAVAALPENKSSNPERTKETLRRMDVVENALKSFRAANSSYPCPADITLAVTNSNFGTEAGTPGTCAGSNYISGNAVSGGVPVIALGLASDYALDGWGRRFTYNIDKRSTRPSILSASNKTLYFSCNGTTVTFSTTGPSRVAVGDTIKLLGWPNNTPGNVCDNTGAPGDRTFTVTSIPDVRSFTVTQSTSSGNVSVSGSGATLLNATDSGCDLMSSGTGTFSIGKNFGGSIPAMLVLVSHGANGLGGFSSGANATSVRLPTPSNADELDNASLNSGGGVNFDTSFIQKEMTSSFDDIVHYSDLCGSTTGTNVAAASNGGVASTSSNLNYNYSGNGTIDGNRIGSTWGSDGGWHDANSSAPDWLQINFSGTKTIYRVDVFSVQDGPISSWVEPTRSTLSPSYGLTNFEIQSWNGSSWVTIPGTVVTNNNKTWRTVSFAPTATDRIRVYVTGTVYSNYSLVTEVEAYAF